MFTEDAWNAGYTAAMTRFGPYVTRQDVKYIVEAVACHGVEELDSVHAVSDDMLSMARIDVLDTLRSHMRERMAIEAIRNDCVMVTLPHETIAPCEWGMTDLRFTVPVRRFNRPVSHAA